MYMFLTLLYVYIECVDNLGDYLSDLTPFTQGIGFVSTGTRDGINYWYGHTEMEMGNGKSYDNFIVMHPPTNSTEVAYKEYELNGKYSLFTAVVGVARSSNGCENITDGSFSVTISVDGYDKYSRIAYNQTGIGSYDYVSIDVSGANKLKLETSNNGDAN